MSSLAQTADRQGSVDERQSLLGHGGTPARSTVRLDRRLRRMARKYLSFVGPGFLVSVAYIDPGNYATDVAAGATFRFRLLFTVLLSNVFAIVLQSLSIKLGTVTGLNLAENCKAHLSPVANYTLYAFAEIAIIATDVAEVIGTAVALNILFGWPLVIGCIVSIADVLAILVFYRPTGMTMKALRLFEGFVMVLVVGVVICFVYLLSLLKNAPMGEVVRGFAPSWELLSPTGLYQSCGILGATVMPHSLYLGSGIVQARLHKFDNYCPDDAGTDSRNSNRRRRYRPSMSAINSCLSYSLVETAVSLLTFALFVNSAILIVAGSALYEVPDASNGDIFLIHKLLSSLLSPLAGTVFALSLLLSGTSAGIVCTIAGQMVSEGQLEWKVSPPVRRLITRALSIVPTVAIAVIVGREGLNAALEGSQVVLSAILPIVTAPLIWFTCSSAVMTVEDEKMYVTSSPAEPELEPEPIKTNGGSVEREVLVGTSDRSYGTARRRLGDGQSVSSVVDVTDRRSRSISMRNGRFTTAVSIAVWVFVVGLNVALLILMAFGLA